MSIQGPVGCWLLEGREGGFRAAGHALGSGSSCSPAITAPESIADRFVCRPARFAPLSLPVYLCSYALSPEKQQAVASETRRVWCSLAERLGMFALKV